MTPDTDSGDEFAPAPDDDAEFADLIADLQSAGRLEAVPPEAAAAAKAGFMWRTIDAELAELTYDSLLDEELLAGVRSAGTSTRSLTFESPVLTVEVEAIPDGSRRRLVGQLVPPQAGRVEVRTARGAVVAEADEMGRFSLGDLPPGPASLRCEGRQAGAAVSTDWVLL